MTDVTNRTVAALLFVAMAVTVFSTAITLNKLNVLQGGDLTGFAQTPNATAQLEISSTTSIVFTNAVIDWSNGTVNQSGGPQCNLTTVGYSGGGYPYSNCIGFATTTPGDFQLENDGNQNVIVNLTLDSNIDTVLGGTAAYADVWGEVSNTAGDGGCYGTTLATDSQISNAANATACTQMNYSDVNDRINISLKVGVPGDAPTGVKTFDVIATATAI